MAQRFYINTSKEATLLASVGTADVTFNLSGSGMVNVPAAPFTIRIDPDTPQEEVCLVTAGSATSLTVTRGFDGTSTFSHTAGAKVRHVVVAEFFNKADAHVEASINVHGLTGGAAVVGTTQLQTLSGKTLNDSITDVAHSTSPAATQAHRVHADAATAKDGYVWDNSGSSTGKAFLAKVAGVDKTYIEGDGDLVVGGTTTTTGITNTGALTSTGALVNNGTAKVTGAVDLDSTLNVDGTTSLVGTVTVGAGAALNFEDPPSAGHAARVHIPARASDLAVTIFNDTTGLTSATIRGSGNIATLGGLEFYDTARVVGSHSTGGTIVPSPVNNMLFFNTTTGMLQRYDSATTSWVNILYYGAVASGGFARYFTNTVQSIPDIVTTPLQFHTAVTTSGDVTASGAGNTQFTLNRAGVWSIHATAVFASGSGFREVAIRNQSGPTRYASQNMNASATSAALTVSTERVFTSGTVIEITAFQASGGALNTLPVEGMHAVSFRWVRP